MIEEFEESIDNYFQRDLLKSRGEKLVNCEIFQDSSCDENSKKVVLTFEDTDQIDIENTYKVMITANDMKFGIRDAYNNPMDIENIIGKRLLDYGEVYMDNYVDSGPLKATLIFEDDYEISVDGYNILIEKHGDQF